MKVTWSNRGRSSRSRVGEQIYAPPPADPCASPPCAAPAQSCCVNVYALVPVEEDRFKDIPERVFGRQRTATIGGIPIRPGPTRLNSWPVIVKPRVTPERESNFASLLAMLFTGQSTDDSDTEPISAEHASRRFSS